MSTISTNCLKKLNAYHFSNEEENALLMHIMHQFEAKVYKFVLLGFLAWLNKKLKLKLNVSSVLNVLNLIRRHLKALSYYTDNLKVV